MLFVLAFVLVVLTGILIVASVAPQHKVAAWLGVYLLGYAQIVLAGELAGLLNVLDQAWFFLSFHAVSVLVGGFFWWRAGRPALWNSLFPVRDTVTPSAFRAFIKSQPALSVLTLIGALAMLYSAVLIVVVPPNNNDTLRYHLARVGFWLQHGNLAAWPTSLTQQIFSPINPQLNFLWLILLTGGDKLVGFVQWSAILITMLGIYGLARLLERSRPAAYGAAIFYLCYPIVLLQASSAQVDMLTTFLYISVLYFFWLASRTGRHDLLFFSALALGLGLGTKQTFYYMLPALGIFILAVSWSTGHFFARLVRWGLSLVLCFAVFGVYINIMNWQNYRNPFGPREEVEYTVNTGGLAGIVESIGLNTPRIFYNALDTSGLPRPLDGYAHKIKAYTLGYFLRSIVPNLEGTYHTHGGYPFDILQKTFAHEDSAWFGPLSVLVLLPVLSRELFRSWRARNYAALGLILGVPVFLICHLILWTNWSPYFGRYFAPVVAAATPLLACVNWEERKGKHLQWLIVGLALVIIPVTVLYNPAKQTLGKQAKWVNIWTADRATLMTIQDFGARDLMLIVQEHVPANTTLGMAHVSSLNQYALFGAGLTRRLIPVYPVMRLGESAWLDEQGIQYLLAQNDPSLPDVPDEYRLISQVEGWRLYQREP